MECGREMVMGQCHDMYPVQGYQPSEAAAVPGAQCHDAYEFEDQCLELVLAAKVRQWADRVAPGDEATMRAATDRALERFRRGASFSEAYEWAQRALASRRRHPSHA